MLHVRPHTARDAGARPPSKQVPVTVYMRGAVTETSNTTISEQTAWMIAVRDHRDKTAFAHLFDFFAPRIKGMLMRGAISAAQAEDTVQDAMLKVWRKADQFDPDRSQVSGWVYQIARNSQIDMLRKDKRPIPEELMIPDEAEPDASHVIALEQEASLLKTALAALKPEQRHMVEQAYFGDLTHAQISAQTGLPLGTIKSRIRLGLERLRHELNGKRT